MPINSSYVFIASMDVEPDKEEEFNDVYDSEHIPLIKTVPGVLSVARFQLDELTLILGGERRTIQIENEPKYAAMYEVESPHVLTSDAWGEAVDSGRWPENVRPYTKNRRHVLLKRMGPK